jgi:hypothetical protein
LDTNASTQSSNARRPVLYPIADARTAKQAAACKLIRPLSDGAGLVRPWIVHHNIDHMIGKDFEIGLANLKRLTER